MTASRVKCPGLIPIFERPQVLRFCRLGTMPRGSARGIAARRRFDKLGFSHLSRESYKTAGALANQALDSL